MVTIKDAREVSMRVKEVLHPITIIVFGSVAKVGVGEDLDLLIITEDRKDIGELNRVLSGQLKEFYKRFAIDPFIIPVSKLREYFFKGSPFLRLIQNEGRTLYMKDSVREWLRHAEEDVEMAKYLLDGGYYRGACYHSQQAIEKALKAGLLQMGWELEKIHSIERLKVIAEDYKLKVDIDEDDVILIDSIYRGRYPAEEGLLPLGEPNEEDAMRSINIATKTVEQIKRYFKEEKMS
jgi:HEPN domain-containing protein